MKANETPEKIYLRYNHKGDIGAGWLIFPLTDNDIEYTRTDALIKKAKEYFCKAVCNGHPPRSTCTSLGTCKKYDNFVKYLKGE